MDNNTFLIRFGAGIFAVFALVLVSIEMTREDDAPEPPVITRQGTLPDLQRRDLRRCLDLGEAATRDATCRQLWAKERERFLTPKSGERLTQPSGVGASADPNTGVATGKPSESMMAPASPPGEER